MPPDLVLPPIPERRRQGGFMLAELMITVVVVGSMIVAGLHYWNMQTRSELARSVGAQFALVNAATGTYLATHYNALRKLDPACSSVQLTAGGAVTPLPATCSVPLSSVDANGITTTVAYTVDNGLQPTIADLVALGLLAKGTADKPGFLPQNTVLRNGAVATYTFAILIEHACTAGPALSVLPPDTPAACAPDTKDLRSLVFNSQPFLQGAQAFGAASMLSDAMLAAGGDASLSSAANDTPLAKGELHGKLGAFTMSNPIRLSASQGVYNILAVRNGYGSSGWMQFTRRDGSMPPTSDWDFAGKSLGNVGTLTAARVETTDIIASNGRFQQLKLKDATPGAACSTQAETVAFYRADNAMLVCGDGNTWTRSAGRGVSEELAEFYIKGGSGYTTSCTGFAAADWTKPALTSYYQDTSDGNYGMFDVKNLGGYWCVWWHSSTNNEFHLWFAMNRIRR